VVEQLKKHGKVERGWLGIEIQEVTPEIALGFGLAKPAGALIAGLGTNGPAVRAGFAQGDVILAVNGHDIIRMRDLPLVVAEMTPGQSAEVTVWRQNQEIILRPIIAAMPHSSETADLGQHNIEVRKSPMDVGAGLKLAPLTPVQRRRLQVPVDVNGVVVTAIGDDSPLARLDLVPGDVIEAVGQQRVVSPEDALAKIKAAVGSNKVVLMLISRHGASRYVALSLSDREIGTWNN